MARAILATRHIRSPDRSRSGSAHNFGGNDAEDAELARLVESFLQQLPCNTSRRAIAESEAASNAPVVKQQRSNGFAANSSNTAKSSKGKGKEVAREVIMVDDSDTEDDIAEITEIPKRSSVQQSRKPTEKQLRVQPTASIQSAPVLETAPPNIETAQPTSVDSSSTKSPFLLDRAAMERERLARQKRIRGDVNAPNSSSNDDESDGEDQNRDEESEKRGAKRRKLDDTPEKSVPIASSSFANNPAQGKRDNEAPTQSLPKSGEELFLKGEVRPTWNEYAHDDRKRFRIQDVIGDKEDLALVITASFCQDPEWINQHFPDPSLVPTIHIQGPSSSAESERWTMETEETGGGRPGSATVWCLMPQAGTIGSGSMHMKFMLLFSKTGRLRVVISSANLVSYDWESIENIVFIQDLQPTDKQSTDVTTVSHDWPMKLQRLFDRYMKIERTIRHLKQFHPMGSQIPLDMLRVGQRSLATLGKWDWSQVAAELAVSVPGKETGEMNVARTGKTGLAACLRRRGWVPSNDQELVAEFQSSSLSGLHYNFMWDFYDCLRGQSATAIARTIRPKPRSGQKRLCPPIRIVFPTLRTVMNSLRGPEGAKTMFCSETNWAEHTKDSFFDANCKAAKVMMHTKCILATFRPKGMVPSFNSPRGPIASNSRSREAVASTSAVGGWYYIGSHNFSAFAWGTMKMEGTHPQISVRNYEMGVILPLPVENTEQVASEIATWQRPPRKYDTQNDKPWMQRQFGEIVQAGADAVNAEAKRYVFSEI
ncbi:hypothetical protein QFC22_005178 [Naganishia vaughanmartiniae]|uniref:Uncharacterized protein n=1 Tax=Naganishia vaughanmartiniae TaxID=1424756 RepID=A0ACC2WX87_9TREE|nr:hypothetical protein QFC22_005178 [Naganishia vaughanmartiniae]